MQEQTQDHVLVETVDGKSHLGLSRTAVKSLSFDLHVKFQLRIDFHAVCDVRSNVIFLTFLTTGRSHLPRNEDEAFHRW